MIVTVMTYKDCNTKINKMTLKVVGEWSVT